MLKLLIAKIFIFLTISGYTQSSISHERLLTLTRAYGVIKYYNNEKDDKYLDDELTRVFSHLNEPTYDNDRFNSDFKNLLPSDQRSLNSSSALQVQNPFNQFEGKDHVSTIDFSWIDQDKLLSDDNKKLLQQLIDSHKKVSNSNIKKKFVFVHHENDELDSLSDSDRYLLGLIKYWNVIEYFFPYKVLMDADWDTVFYDAIPDFHLIKSDENYLTMLKKLSAKLNDSHVDVEDDRINDYNVSKLPFSITEAENKLVIRSINDSLSNLYHVKTGDIVEVLDGKNYSELWQEFSELVSYSTPQAGRSNFKIYLWHRFNDNDSIIQATIKSNNSIHQESIKTIKLEDFRKFRPWTEHKGGFRSINDKIGYIEYSDFNYSDLGKAIRKLKRKDYLILDCRGYNYGLSSLRLLNFLGYTKTPLAKYYKSNLDYPGIFDNPKKVRLRILPKLRSTYKGKVIVLINEEALSAMESLLMAIEIRRSDVVFIGSPTQGCNGEMNLMELPGERKVWFTGGGDWRYPDGSQFQRIGIQPDIHVEPTIESIINNEDIILNRAIEYINNIIVN